MKPKTTLAFFLTVVAALAALWWFGLREGAGPAAGEKPQTHVFAGLDAKDIAWVDLAQGDGSAVRLERRGAEWRIVRPVDTAADRFAADGIATGLAELASDVVYDPKAEDAARHPEPLENYGLTREPRVRFSAAQKEYALRIGDATPVSGNVYVRGGDDPRVFAVPSWQTSAFTKPLSELREARLLSFDRESLDKLSLSWSGGGAVLQKTAGTWKLASPLADAADDTTVQTLISDLETLRAEGFLDTPPSDAELGLATPTYRVELELAGAAKPLALAIGAPRDGARLAARGGSGAVVEIPASSLERLPKTVNALRDKRLASFSTTDAKRFTLAFAGGEGGALSVTGTNAEDGWKTEPAMAPGAASALVAELAGLVGKDIAADALGAAERAALGLAPPRAILRVLGAGEGDKAPVLAEVRLGIAKAGSGIAAQRADRETVYWIDEALSAQLPTNAAQFRARFAAREGAPAPAPAAPPPVSPPPPPGE